MPWGLALSGGGVMGATHLGVLRALEEWGRRPGVLAGASAGGLIVGALAAGATVADITAAGAEVSRRPLDYFRPRAVRLLAELIPDDPLPPADALVDPAAFLDRFTAACPLPHRVEAWRRPAAITTVNLATMEAIAFVCPPRGGVVPPKANWRVRTAGDLRAALQATMAMPGVFAPVRGEGEFLVDGGVADNLPWDWAAALGATRILAVDVAPLGAGLPGRPGLIWSLSRVESYFTHTLSDLRRPKVPILTLTPDTSGASVLGFGEYDHLVDIGYQTAVSRRAEIEAFLDGAGAPAQRSAALGKP